MQLVDRIEKRRFVGREFLLWLWFESELFDATLQTPEHGSFGLWLEKRLILSLHKDSTRVVAAAPGYARQAKAALLAGQLPESAAIRIALREEELGFVLKAERLAVGGLKLPKRVEDEAAPNALAEMGPRRGKRAAKRSKRAADDEAHEAFYERMQRTEEFERVIETLFAEFKALRMSANWETLVVPMLRAWAKDEPFSHEAYVALRRPAEASQQTASRAPVVSGDAAASS